jgi:hypothetical protein
MIGQYFRRSLAVFFMATGCAHALTLDTGIRSISVDLTDSVGNPIASASDSESVINDAPYTKNLVANIGGGGYSASVGMNMVGFFGIDVSSTVSGRLSTSVTVLETYTNDAAFAIDLKTSFIVVDGLLDLVAAANGTLTLDLSVGTFPFGDFNGVAQLTGSDLFASTLVTSGDSLGATQSAPGTAAAIPFSVNDIDLGRLEPGESIDYFYSLLITVDAPVLEITRWQFLDPSTIATLPSNSVVTAVTAVPLPGTFGLLGCAIVAIFRTRMTRRI